jgi:hypothetical protein
VTKKTRRLALIGAFAAVALLAAVGGYAYWTTGGSGSGSATAGTTSTLTVNQTSTVIGLSSGGAAQALSGNFDNPNAGAVPISSVTASVTGVTGAGTDGAKPACTTGDFTIGGSAAGSSVPSGTGVGSWSGLTVQMVNGAGNQDNCKSATAQITYTANP